MCSFATSYFIISTILCILIIYVHCIHLKLYLVFVTCAQSFGIYLIIFNFKLKVLGLPSCLIHPLSRLRQLTWHPLRFDDLLHFKVIITLSITICLHSVYCLCHIYVPSINRPNTAILSESFVFLLFLFPNLIY